MEDEPPLATLIRSNRGNEDAGQMRSCRIEVRQPRLKEHGRENRHVRFNDAQWSDPVRWHCRLLGNGPRKLFLLDRGVVQDVMHEIGYPVTRLF